VIETTGSHDYIGVVKFSEFATPVGGNTLVRATTAHKDNIMNEINQI
jgi:hypothetical protein